MTFKKLLIANRGEIAIRIARAAADLGLPTVAIHSEDDATSLHVRVADAAHQLAGVGAAAYLNVDGVIAAAAPCDFEPAARVPGKIPRKGSGLSLVLEPTPDIIATLSRRATPEQWMVAFALEPGADPRRALEKIDAKACDLIVVNDLTAVNAGTTAVAVYDAGHAKVGERRGTKGAVSAWLVRLIAVHCSTPVSRRPRGRRPAGPQA